jgi:hypothetical protein
VYPPLPVTSAPTVPVRLNGLAVHIEPAGLKDTGDDGVHDRPVRQRLPQFVGFRGIECLKHPAYSAWPTTLTRSLSLLNLP